MKAVVAMKLPRKAHTSHPWRIHEIARDFRLEDVWEIRTPGAGPDDFPAMLAAMRAPGADAKDPAPLRFLLAVRWKLGALFGRGSPAPAGVGARGGSLRERLPRDLRDLREPSSGSPDAGSDDGFGPMTSVYELDDEAAFEVANKTVHAVMHLGWAPATVQGGGHGHGHGRGRGHGLRMAVLVKRNGLAGRLYMAAITPFRRPAERMLGRRLERAWRDRDRPAPAPAPAPAQEPVTSAVGTREVPESVCALSSLRDIDYVDYFLLETDVMDVKATPEQWARAMFGDVPTPAERLIWRGLLGIRLSRGRSPDTVAGWRIAGRGEDWIRLEAASWFLTGNLLVQVASEGVSLGTFLRYDRRLAARVWPPLSAVHRRLVPGLLRDAAAKIRARQ